MTRTSRLLRYLGVIVLSMFMLAGCSNATGGGWIPSATGTGKATFGFTFQCKDRSGNAQLSGQLQYQDKPSGVSLHGIMSDTYPDTSCADLEFEGFENIAQFDGVYQPQPKGTGGSFSVTMIDAGEPGKLDDGFCIQLYGGLHNNYENNCPLLNGGEISGGNIQVRTSK